MKISYQDKHGFRGVLILCIDDEPWREIHTTIFGRKPSLPQRCVTLTEFAEKFSGIEYQAAKGYAFKRLAMKMMSTSEMRKGLSQRLVSEGVAQRVIDECVRLGFLNEQVWLDAYVRSLIGRKYGPQTILYKLRSKGVPQDIADEVLEKLNGVDGEGNVTRIQQLLTTKYRSRNLSEYKERGKVIAALIRKGFSFDDILKAIREKMKDEEP